MDLDKLLENRETLLYWDSPEDAWTEKDKKITINVCSSMTVQNAIDVHRWQRLFIIPTAKPLNDKELLDDFMIVYSAYTKQEATCSTNQS